MVSCSLIDKLGAVSSNVATGTDQHHSHSACAGIIACVEEEKEWIGRATPWIVALQVFANVAFCALLCVEKRVEDRCYRASNGRSIDRGLCFTSRAFAFRGDRRLLADDAKHFALE